MNAQQRHRGPDDEGYLVADLVRKTVEPLRGDESRLPAAHEQQQIRSIHDVPATSGTVVLAHRRLSILDPSAAGHQPMSAPDGRYHLVYNGEVYNYLELREELERTGWKFESSSDTEVVLAALALWGVAALERFVGMFALAWLDLVEQRVVLARDPFGIKPLHYCRTSTGLAFASEPAALLELSGFQRQLDPHAAYAYLRFNVTDHDERTFFTGISQLPPAHFLTIDLGSFAVSSPRRFWWADRQADSALSYSQATQQLQQRFLDSVRWHLRSDVPVAVMLSGGIDSSSVTMAARRVLGETAAVEAFGYLGPDERANEEKWMELVATAGRLQLNRVVPERSSLAEQLDRVIRQQQAPFGSLSILAQACVYRAVAEQGIKVILSGQGADELLGGYGPFAAARLASLLLAGRWVKARQFYVSGSRGWPGRKRMVMGLAQYLLPDVLQAPLRRISGYSATPDWITASWFRDRDVVLASPRSTSGQGGATLKSALRDSLTRTNLPELLRYEDRNSMACSVESRVPFLTSPLVNFILSLPESYIINDNCLSKAALRDAMRTVVPDAVLDRRDKVAFSAPLGQWFAEMQPYFEASLQPEALARLPMLNSREVRQRWNRVQVGQARPDGLLWRWVNLSRWIEQFQVAAA